MLSPPIHFGDFMDLLYLLLSAAFFVLTAGLVPLFEKLRRK